MTALPESRALQQQGLLGELDLQFAEMLGRLSDDEPAALFLAAALCSAAREQGHVCLDLVRMAGIALGTPEICRTPELSVWKRQLVNSPLVGKPGEFRPLILDPKGRLYLYRYWDYERRVAEILRLRGVQTASLRDEGLLRQGLNSLFPANKQSDIDWQRVAAATALLRNFTVISGGPGTGKTSTVVRIIALLQQQGIPARRIALAAPTGKAAARLESSLRQANERLEASSPAAAELPNTATTVHRLLGSQPGSPYFRHHRENPLVVDVLIVDEASMVDIALMCKLLEALPMQSRLILLGDHNQLASVEAGAVLGDICGYRRAFSANFATWLERLLGVSLAGDSSLAPLADSIVMLRRSYRFAEDSGIGVVAEAVNNGDLSPLLFQEWRDVEWLQSDKDPIQHAVAGFRHYMEAVASAASPEEVFRVFDRFRVLTVLRRGIWGAEGLNRAIESELRALGLLHYQQGWYPGMPAMIARNDYGLGLYNGDVGICLATDQGRGRVYFQSSQGAVRSISVSRLPAHETAFAMTVHKSQGSEFEQVLMVLPDRDSPLLTRELLYTGITRARSTIQIRAPREILEVAIGRRSQRSSGLREALWGETDDSSTSGV